MDGCLFANIICLQADQTHSINNTSHTSQLQMFILLVCSELRIHKLENTDLCFKIHKDERKFHFWWKCLKLYTSIITCTAYAFYNFILQLRGGARRKLCEASVYVDGLFCNLDITRLSSCHGTTLVSAGKPRKKSKLIEIVDKLSFARVLFCKYSEIFGTDV